MIESSENSVAFKAVEAGDTPQIDDVPEIIEPSVDIPELPGSPDGSSDSHARDVGPPVADRLALVRDHLPHAIVAGVVVVALAAVGVMRVTSSPSLCAALSARPAGLATIELEEARPGMSQIDATWFNVLTDGVRSGDEASRLAMSTAISDDPAGYEQLLDRVPAERTSAVERLHSLARNPGASRSMVTGPATDADVLTLVQLRNGADCGS